MAETLRDMVVSLSLNSDNFSANLRTINQQLKEADSQFKLAASGVTNFENTAAGAQAQLQNLQQKFQLQQQAVQQYERALEAAQKKLETSVQSHEKLGAKLETAKQKHADLGQQVDKLTADLKEAEEAGLKGTSTYAEMEAELEQLKAEYAASSQEVERLEGQLSRSENTVRRNADAVTRANTNLNNARSALQQTQGQIDQVTSRLERMQNAWLNAADKMAKFGEKAKTVGKSVEGVGRSMSKVSAVVIGSGVAAVKTFANYDDAIRQVYATMGLSEAENAEDMKALSDAAQEMGATTRYSASEAAEALNYLALAGYDSKQAIEALPTVLRLAQAGGIDLASASDMVTDSMSALGLEMSYMPTFADQMAKTAQKSNTSVAQLGEGILKVSATAKNLKGGTVEMNTALGILADNGIKGAEGGTHLRNVILSLQNPTDVAAKRMAAMGVEIYDAQGNMRGLNEIFGDMDKAMAGWNQQAKDAAMSDIFNKTDLTAVNALISNCSDRWNELSSEISNCEGTAGDMAEMMEGGIGGAFRSLKSAIEGLAISFGDTLAPMIKSVAEKVTEYTRKFASLDEAHKKTIVKIAAIVAAAGPLVLIIGKIITAVGTTATGISKLMVGVTKIPGTVTKITSTIATFASKGVTSVKTFMTAVSSAGGGFKGLISVIASSPAAIAVFAAAAAYGIYKLIDWASGAKAAREAQERLNKTVEEWGDNVTTAFEKAKGLSAFSLTPEDFSVSNSESNWLDQTLATWTDGKKETDAIVADTVKGFTDGTDKIRTSLQSLKDSAGGTAIGDLDGDLEKLDAIDKEVESILKKKQNGYLSDNETARLQQLIDEREAIKVKYSLVSDSEDAFSSIVDGVEAAVSRGADKADTFNNAFAAATQGLGAFTDSLNAEYDARYKAISAMEDGAAKEQAMLELRQWYDEQAAAATQQYYDTVSQAAELTDAFADDGKFGKTTAQLTEINSLMQAAAGKDSASAEMNALREALAGLDESSIVEMEASISAMEAAAAAAGVEVPEEVKAAREALDQVKSAALDTSNVFSEDVSESFNSMFSGLGDEVHEVYATLNCDGLSTAYDAWAKGEHAPIIPTLDTKPITFDATAPVTLTDLPESIELSATAPVELTGLPDTITLSATAPVTLTGLPDTVSVAADAPVTLTGVPETITVNADSPVTITGLPDGPITIPANSPTTLTGVPDSIDVECESPVTLTGIPESMTVQCDSPVTMTGVPETMSVDCEAPVTLTGVPDSVTVQCTAPVTLTGIPETIEVPGKVNFDGGQYTNSARPDLEFETGSTKTKKNFIGLTDFSASSQYENIHNLAIAVREYNAAIESGDTDAANAWMDSIYTIGDMVASDLGYDGGMGFQVLAQFLANGMQLLSEGSMDADQIERFATVYGDLMTIMNSDIGTNAAYSYNLATSLPEGLSEALNDYDWNTTGDNVLESLETGFASAQERGQQVGSDLSAGIGEGEAAYDFSGDADATISNDEAALRESADSHSPAARFNPLGEDIAAGIGEGMSQHDFSAEAEAVMAAIQSSFAADLLAEAGASIAQGLADGMSGADMSGTGSTVAANVQSAIGGNLTATTLIAAGMTATGGLAAGMNAFKFAGIGSSIASRVKSSVSASLNASTLSSVGRNAMAGLAAGIRSGSASVVSAMRAAALAAVRAAKSSLKIQSPSRVFRDEVGTMVMRGFGEGIQEETRNQAKIIGNAARYLTSAAQGGISTGSTDNRRTYNNTSSVTLQVAEMNVRDKQDIRSLAVEIAGLTRTQQRGKGLRMA